VPALHSILAKACSEIATHVGDCMRSWQSRAARRWRSAARHLDIVAASRPRTWEADPKKAISRIVQLRVS
jgi:hypothetical protein